MATEVPTNEQMASCYARYSAMPLNNKELVMYHMIGKNKSRVWLEKSPDFWGDFKMALDYIEGLTKFRAAGEGDSEIV